MQVYYKEAVGAFVVFDVTRPATFEAVQKWKHDLDSKVLLPDDKPIPIVLLANKVPSGEIRFSLFSLSFSVHTIRVATPPVMLW